MRVVSSPGACKGTETAISWNKTGPSGPQGEPGKQGEPGLQGKQGPAGESSVERYQQRGTAFNPHRREVTHGSLTPSGNAAALPRLVRLGAAKKVLAATLSVTPITVRYYIHLAWRV